MKKKILSIMLVTMMTVATLAGCGSKTESESADAGSAAAPAEASAEGLSVGFVNLANTDVFAKTRMDTLQSAVDASGAHKMESADGNNDVQKQVDQINTFIAKGCDVVMVSPCDSDGIVPGIEAANAQNVPIVCFGIQANGGDYIYIGSPNYEAGKMQGEYFAEILPENATVCYLHGTMGLSHSMEREAGFLEALEAARPDVKVIENQDGDYVKDEGMRITETWIQKYGDGKGGVTFNAIVAANDQMALGAMEALKSAGIQNGNNEVMISGVDGTPDAVQAIVDGNMVQSVLQDAPGQAEAGLEVLNQIAAGETPEKEILVPFISITTENVADYQ